MLRSARRSMAAGSGLYLVVTAPGTGHVSVTRAAVERGVPVVQLREKELDAEELEQLGAEMHAITRESSTLLIVNDRPEVAAAIGADGVHVGRADAACADARRIVGHDAIVGVSVHDAEETAAAVAAGADYVGAGPVFPTLTKADADEPIGIKGLRSIVTAAAGLPVVAIGGIDAGKARSLVHAGADYVAVISAVCNARDAGAAIDELQNVLGKTR